MPVPEDSLFSLELVIDKLYIPHVVCRFPAVAFRLLDFPTILISHVEAELGDRIKAKISRDSHYTTPNQFSELQDNHGNYMVKKGKSCLFRTSVDSLKTHLANTPLYVMALDMFPETPKLIGNSSVPLNGLMKHICADIAKKGVTVPSVHGDKGLFKIYSLMGQEIGYIVLGFRLLCLGPSFVEHIPSKKLQQTKLMTVDKNDKRDEVNLIYVQPVTSKEVTVSTMNNRVKQSETGVRSSQDMGSMTDAMKHDVLLQTIPTEEKGVHVVISETERPKPKLSSMSTQTQKHRKRHQHILLQGLDMKPENNDEDDFLEMPNIVCPPPLFYNKYSQPNLRTERPIDYTDDECVDDISEVGSICGRKHPLDSVQIKPSRSNASPRDRGQNQITDISVGPVTVHESRKQQKLKSVNYVDTPDQSNTVFPILTALLNELVGIQGTHGLENVIKKVHDVAKVHQLSPRDVKRNKTVEVVPPSVARSTLSSESKKINRKDVISSKNKGWLRKQPEFVPKIGKLTYRLTKTQKLRIAKSNPKWLLEKEKSEESHKPKILPQESDHEEDLNVTNFSDTLTEVRRLAEKELANETLDSIATIESPQTSPKHYRKKVRTKKAKLRDKPTPKSSPIVKQKQVSPTAKLGPRQSFSSRDVHLASSNKSISPAKDQTLKIVKSSPSVMEHDDLHPIQAVEPDLRRFVSPDIPSNKSAASEEDTEGHPSPTSQKSVEVHLPKAFADEDTDDDISLPDNDRAGTKMSGGLVEQSYSFRESILGKSQTSLDVSENADDHGPMESTRTSQNYRNEFGQSKAFHSTTDNDSKQFMSTEEPELKQLMSDDDSQDSVQTPRYVPTFADTSSKPSIRSSLKFPVLNPVASDNSPIPASRKPNIKTEGRTSSKNSDIVSSPGSSMVPTPRARRFPPKVRDSVHTESVSSYVPSDADHGLSLNSDANYSDDFQFSGSMGSVSDLSHSLEVPPPRRIPSTKLGYTIS